MKPFHGSPVYPEQTATTCVATAGNPAGSVLVPKCRALGHSQATSQGSKTLSQGSFSVVHDSVNLKFFLTLNEEWRRRMKNHHLIDMDAAEMHGTHHEL